MYPLISSIIKLPIHLIVDLTCLSKLLLFKVGNLNSGNGKTNIHMHSFLFFNYSMLTLYNGRGRFKAPAVKKKDLKIGYLKWRFFGFCIPRWLL